MISMHRLWAAQEMQWPNSVRVLPQELLVWAHNGANSEERFRRMSVIATTTQFDRVMFYITDPDGGHIGARYGVEPHEYISGFNFFKCRINETGHIEDTTFV